MRLMRTLDRNAPFCENIPPIAGGKYTQHGILFNHLGVEIGLGVEAPKENAPVPAETPQEAVQKDLSPQPKRRGRPAGKVARKRAK